MMHSCGFKLGLAAAAAAALVAVASPTTTKTMEFAGLRRAYVEYAPSAAPAGLIVVLSPVDASGLSYFCDTIGPTVMQATGAVIVCPAALQGSCNACWRSFENYGYCYRTHGTADGLPECDQDVRFLQALLAHVQGQHRALPTGKVLLSGHSNGGSMAYRFYCERSELIGKRWQRFSPTQAPLRTKLSSVSASCGC